MRIEDFVQDYKEAARIRDSLRLFEEEEPVLRLKRMIKEAIADERFQVCVFIVLLLLLLNKLNATLILIFVQVCFEIWIFYWYYVIYFSHFKMSFTK